MAKKEPQVLRLKITLEHVDRKHPARDAVTRP